VPHSRDAVETDAFQAFEASGRSIQTESFSRVGSGPRVDRLARLARHRARSGPVSPLDHAVRRP
jgi:hypothetical protein